MNPSNETRTNTREELDRLLREIVIPESGLTELESRERPTAIVLAGQPGSGKSTLVRAAVLEFNDDILVIDPDRLRDNLPNAKQLQLDNPFGWPQETNKDAFRMANGLRDAGIRHGANIVIDGSMSDADNSIRTIRDLQKKGCQVEVRAIAAHWLESELGIDQRFTRDISKSGVARDVDMEFHNRVYNALPDNLNKVAQATGVPVRIYDRELNGLYDSRRDLEPANAVLRELRSGRVEDPEVRQRLQNGWTQQQSWHEAMPDAARARADLPPTAVQALIDGHAERGKLERATVRAETLHAIEAPAQAVEPLLPRLNRAGTVAGLAGVGLAAAAVDARETGERISTAFAQDNPAAARSEATHLLGRGGGGAAAGLTAYAIGASSAPAVALVMADAYLLSEAFERGAKLLDRQQIVKQTRDGVDWEFNGRQWIREDLRADLIDDGRDVTEDQKFSALPDKARELSYFASVEAVGQAIGKADPRNPFVQPPNDQDASHLATRDWTRNPESGQWSRMYADEVGRNDAPRWSSEPEYATPERAAALDRQALQVIDQNIAQGPAAMAAHYQIGHKRRGFDFVGPEPPVVKTALNPDTLEGSNGKQYGRDVQGRWSHEGEFAQGNLALELETTRERLRPALRLHQEQLAEVPPWQAPTPEALDRQMLRQAYSDHGWKLKPEQFEAAYAAVQNTRVEHGIGPSTTSLRLGPDESRNFSLNSPIQHMREDADGVVRLAAQTSPEDIALTLAARQSHPAPIPDTPELRIAALSAQQRDAQEQAVREAQRQGLSNSNVQQVAHQAAVVTGSTSPATPTTLAAAAALTEPAAKIDTPLLREPLPATPPPKPEAEPPALIAPDASPRSQQPNSKVESGTVDPRMDHTVGPTLAAQALGGTTASQPPASTSQTDTAASRAQTPLASFASAPSIESPAPAPQRPAEQANTISSSAPQDTATTVNDDTLRQGDQSPAVELLQYRLHRIGYRGPDDQPLAQHGQFDAATDHAVRQFQRDRGRPENGVAAPDMQVEISHAHHARIARTKSEGPAAEPARADEAPDAPHTTQTVVAREPVRRSPTTPDSSEREQPYNVAPPLIASAPAGPWGDNRSAAEVDQAVELSREPKGIPDAPLTHNSTRSERETADVRPIGVVQAAEPVGSLLDAESPPLAPKAAQQPSSLGARAANATAAPDHALQPGNASSIEPEAEIRLSDFSRNDLAMMAKIQANVPDGISKEHIAAAMLAGKRNGILQAESIGPVGVVDGNLWLDRDVPGHHTGVPVNAPAPPLQDTLREAEAFNEHQAQLQSQAQQLEQQHQNEKQTHAMRPQL
ncbi:zeta toxin family protein [Lysobacter sp. CA199]|uniref:zeta toxin family protein n=1 Tax=Lysobacter sp. CA199 TaxID=3455608 RepID=UPI003F8D8C69